ncbi:hypothetical protein L915_11961 [Phytophthora nicotianae]|uniref:Uncharacterized protein n=2 Tax=Phytophthora nicotianae TaxID=4792 RepID=W2GIG6_PHYNI|nr:hypothetical protein L915_11961 [Phytophthora nicotianae]
MRFVACVLSSLAAWRAANALPGSDVFRRDRWTMHDPGFQVKIDVAPSQDEVWITEQRLAGQESDALHVSSTVLDVSVSLPEGFSTNEALVTMSIFEPSSSNLDDAAFEMFIDSHLQYATKYRVELDPNKASDRFVLRVYVEVSAAHRNGTKVEQAGAKLRAFYARWVDLSPSEPRFLSCEKDDTIYEYEDERVSPHPPTNMPQDLCSRYTMDGRMPVRKWYFDDQTGVERSYGEEFSRETIDSLVEDARRKVTGYSSADTFLYSALEKYPLKDKRVLIVGSNGRPWIESLCLVQEATSCTTVARNRLRYNHPKLQTFTTAEFIDDIAAAERFDVILAVKSIASEGLGRAGDPLDPDRDLKVMQELHKLAAPSCKRSTEQGDLKKSVTVFLAVPVGPDTLVWNAQRQYGPLRLPLLLQDWQLLDSYGFSQDDFTAPFTVSHSPLFVLQSTASCDQDTRSTAAEEHTEL